MLETALELLLIEEPLTGQQAVPKELPNLA
jgi:hypothetical protein